MAAFFLMNDGRLIVPLFERFCDLNGCQEVVLRRVEALSLDPLGVVQACDGDNSRSTGWIGLRVVRPAISVQLKTYRRAAAIARPRLQARHRGHSICHTDREVELSRRESYDT